MVTIRVMPTAHASVSTPATGTFMMSRWQWLSTASAGSIASARDWGRASGSLALQPAQLLLDHRGCSLANSGTGAAAACPA